MILKSVKSEIGLRRDVSDQWSSANLVAYLYTFQLEQVRHAKFLCCKQKDAFETRRGCVRF